jgi:hypothetical protein
LDKGNLVKRLIEKGLMFGGLYPVDSPVLVERYNRALKHLTGKTTALQDFHIDISGFAPEVGDELNDPLYLNHDGVNRQFILLSTDQKNAPLLNAHFSTSRGILRQFIAENEQQLFALTARDAVAGELANSVYAVDTPTQLLDIRKVTVEADTTGGTVATAEKLTGLINRFKSDDGAWYDDVLIAEMIELAKVTGDLTRNPVALKDMTFTQDNFWTSHFGGLYLFRGVESPALIATDKTKLGELPIPMMGFADRTAIARFLQANDLVEPIVEARGVDGAAILHQKMDFIVADVATTMGEKVEGATRRDLRMVARKYQRLLPEEWQGLAALARWAEEGGPWPRITSDHPSFFYTLRAKPRADADLVNMMLSELSPMDVRQLYICHKEAFYRAYAGWAEPKKAYVADFLHREYMVDKAGVWESLYGHTPPPSAPAVTPVQAPWGPPRETQARRNERIIDMVGPWGSVRAGRK